RVGDGTFATRGTPVLVVREEGAGTLEGNDWFLDLQPSIAKTIPADKVPIFLVVTANASGAVTATLQFRGQDIGTTGSVFAFAVAPSTNGTTMINNGTNRSAVTVPGAVTCQPQAPQTGWWWNPAQPGRGFSIEVQGTHIFFAAFHYDVSGRSTWNVASGPTSLDGSLFNG